MGLGKEETPEGLGSGRMGRGERRGRIVRRYFLIFAPLVGGSLVASAIVEIAFRFQESRRTAGLLHRRTAEVVALRIRNYIEDIAKAVRLTAHGPEGLTVSARISATSRVAKAETEAFLQG